MGCNGGLFGWGLLNEALNPAWMLGFSLSFPVLFPRLFPRLAVHTILIAAWSVRRHHRQAGAVAIRQHASKAIKLSGVLLRFFVPGSGLRALA